MLLQKLKKWLDDEKSLEFISSVTLAAAILIIFGLLLF